jgi:hypothetical protein
MLKVAELDAIRHEPLKRASAPTLEGHAQRSIATDGPVALASPFASLGPH